MTWTSFLLIPSLAMCRQKKTFGNCMILLGDKSDKALLLFLLQTGARIQEAFRLVWSDVDFEHSQALHTQDGFRLHEILLGAIDKELCRLFKNADILRKRSPRIGGLSTRGSSIGIYFRPHSVLSTSSSSAYLNAASPLNTVVPLSDSLVRASRFMRSVTRA